MYVDESGLEEIRREYARVPMGETILGEITGQQGRRTRIIAGLCEGTPIAPWYFEGYCNNRSDSHLGSTRVVSSTKARDDRDVGQRQFSQAP